MDPETTSESAESQGTAQPNGQGESTASGDGFNWGLFPDVPEDQRTVLEPHLKTVQGHVTKLEQQRAAYKPLMDAGITDPQDVSYLLNLVNAFNSDPKAAWAQLGRNLIKEKVLEGLTEEDLEDLVEGKFFDLGEEEGAQVPPPPGEKQEGQQPGSVPPEVMQELNELKRWKEQLTQQQQQAMQHRQQATDQKFLEQNIEKMKGQLKEKGVDFDVDEELLVASILTSKGDVGKAVERLAGVREASLKGLANKEKPDLELPKGVPPGGKNEQERKGSGGKDPFKQANAAAMNFLEQQAQGGDN